MHIYMHIYTYTHIYKHTHTHTHTEREREGYYVLESFCQLMFIYIHTTCTVEDFVKTSKYL